MSEPRPPATPPPVPKDVATGEWSDVTARDVPKPVDVPTVTSSGQTLPPDDLGIPNPFGRYRIDRLLGRGGMGAVYLAQDTSLERPVALKIPAFGTAPTIGQKERFFREARAVSALHHPNICQVYDVDEEQGILFLTTAFIDGQPLATYLERGPMAPEKAIELVRNVAHAMQAAHSHGTIHRDLKPANIMIDRNGQPVIMDFGLARRTSWGDDSREPNTPTPAKDHGLTQLGSVLGTPAYMPPEQARGDVSAIGPASDVYSLGVILFELLTGRRPYAADDTTQLINKIVNEPPPRIAEFYPWIDPKIDAAIQKAMAKNPADRFGTMAAFERALKDAVEPELKVVLPPPLPKAAMKARPVKKRRWLKPVSCLAITFGFMLVCVGGPTAAIWFLIVKVKDTVKELGEVMQQSNTEWEAINSFWQAPPADADIDVLFPPTLPGNYRRVRNDTEVADAELGLTLPGQRAIYNGPNGDEVEVRAYRAPEPQAKKMQASAEAFVTQLQAGIVPNRTESKRQKVIYTGSNSQLRTVTFGFSDTANLHQEYGKIWYGGDWLMYFRANNHLTIESFPSKFLMEVGKQVSGKRTDATKGK